LEFFFEENGHSYIVIEYCPLGSIRDLILRERGSKKLTKVDLIALAKHAAAGMCYISQLRIIHRDIALRNILVFMTQYGYIAKVTDFGLSRTIEHSYYDKSDSEIPIKWCAPEVLENGTHLSKSDVYSFGVMLWELFNNAKLPYSDYNNDQARTAIKNKEILQCPLDCPKEMYILMKKCWAFTPEQRSNFEQILQEIDEIWKSKDFSKYGRQIYASFEVHQPKPTDMRNSQLLSEGESLYNT